MVWLIHSRKLICELLSDARLFACNLGSLRLEPNAFLVVDLTLETNQTINLQENTR